jgi:hypothetical protein
MVVMMTKSCHTTRHSAALSILPSAVHILVFYAHAGADALSLRKRQEAENLVIAHSERHPLTYSLYRCHPVTRAVAGTARFQVGLFHVIVTLKLKCIGIGESMQGHHQRKCTDVCRLDR